MHLETINITRVDRLLLVMMLLVACEDEPRVCELAPGGRYALQWTPVSGNCDAKWLPDAYNVRERSPCVTLRDQGCTVELMPATCGFELVGCAARWWDAGNLFLCGTLEAVSKGKSPSTYQGDLTVVVASNSARSGGHICDATIRATLTPLSDAGVAAAPAVRSMALDASP
jgi:hypothetical protein